MKAIENALLIAWMKFYPDFRRQPYVMMAQGGLSAGPLFFIFLTGSTAAFHKGIVGAMISITSYMGLSATIHDVVQDRYIKLREMFTAMPIHPASYALGLALAPLMASIPGLLFFMIFALWLGLISLTSIGIAFIILILSWLSVSMLGFTVSTYLNDLPPFMVRSAGQLLSLSLVFIPPVYYSESVLGAFSWISYTLPTSNAASLIRSYLGLSPPPAEGLTFHWLVLISTAFAFFLVASFKARWREK